MTHVVFVRLDFNQETFFFQVRHYFFAGRETVQSLIGPRVFIEGSVRIENIDAFQLVPVAYLKVVKVVRRGDFHHAGPKFFIHVICL
jgi:hypothetical protein